ncbi:MAG: LPS export ABC transporter periplasmic protein LptC [Rickettsia endosymbiont of Bryobia graminum]|nr:LPS export ABC transporter periplasmic protein LptC [Rickettsia endosymbiont of Bryobia graminum]
MEEQECFSKVEIVRNYIPLSRSGKSTILSYKRFRSLLRIITLIGISIIALYFYISFNVSKNNYGKSTSANEKFVDKHDKSKYEIKILNSTFNGLNKNLSPYQINTVQAIRTLDNNYLLETIDAKYLIDSEEELLINADNGVLNEVAQTLKLQNNVQFFLGEGTLKTREAELNLLNKETSSNAGVILFYKNSQLKSKNFKSMDDNNIINFEGNVSTIIETSDF